MNTKNSTTTMMMKGSCLTTNGYDVSSSSDKVVSFGIIRKHDPQHKKNNKCCKCTRSRSSTTITTGPTAIMFLAFYLLIFTVVTSFVTSQPVTNLQARSSSNTNNNNKLIGKPKPTEQAGVAAAATRIPILRILSPQYSYPSLSSSSFYSADSNGNGISTTDVVTTAEHFQQRQAVKNQHYQALSIPIEHVEEEEKREEDELTANQFGNESKEMDGVAVEESVNSPANHSPPLHSSQNNNNGNDNVLSLTLTNTLSTGGGGGGDTFSSGVVVVERNSSSLKYATGTRKEGKKVEQARDKDKVMLTDDVRGSSSTVNPVSSSFSSSSSSSFFSSQNGNSPPTPPPPPPAVTAELRAKVNTITTKKEKKGFSLFEQHSKMNHTTSMNLNLNKSQSQRFMSTSVVPTGKQDEDDEQVTATTITGAWMKKENASGSISGNVEDYYYYGHDVEKNTTGKYANVVNNHVNFVEKTTKERKQLHQTNSQMKEKQQGFDTDYSNKKRASSTRIEEVDVVDDDESPSNDKDITTGTRAASTVASLLGVSDSGIGKSSFLSPSLSSSSSADSSSTSRGNLMKSTQRSGGGGGRPVTEMNSGIISNNNPSPVQVAVDKKNNEHEKRSTATTTFAVFGENSKEDNVYHQQQEQSHFYPDYSYDSPVSLLTGEEKDDRPFPPSYFSLSTASSSSSSSPPLLMNKWIKTLVKLSQCRANCLDQASRRRRAYHWDVTLGRHQQNDILQENHGQAAAAADNQEGATKAPSSIPLPPDAATTDTPNWSEFNQQEEKPKTPVVYTAEQMKEKRSSGSNPPLAPFFPTASTATPGRTIKVTPSKSMKYYELSTCQKVCQMKFPIEDHFYYSSTTASNLASHNNNDHSINSLLSNDKKVVKSLTSEDNKNGIEKKEQDMEYSSNNNIINGSDNSSGSSHHRTASGNNNSNGNNNGSNNNNTENNNNNENIERKTPVEKRGERSGGGDDDVVSVDRKRNNNQQHYYLPSSNDAVGGEEEEEQVLKEISGREALSGGGGSNDLPLMMKLLAIERGFVDEKENKQEQQHEHSAGTTFGEATAGSLNNLKTFPSEPGLKLGQVSLKRKKGAEEEEKERKDEDSDGGGGGDVSTTFSLSSASLILQLSWPKPSSWDRDDHNDDNNKNKQPEGTPPAAAQVKDKKGIHFDGASTGTDEKLVGEIKAQRPVSASFPIKTTPAVVYSIILEEGWNGKGSDDDGTGDMYHAQRMKLIDQIVARTTTQISLPALSIVNREEKVQSEQKRNEDEKEKKNNNKEKRKEKMSVSEQKVERIPSVAADASMEGNKEKIVIIKGNENKRNPEEGIMMMSKPLPPPPSPPPSPPPPFHEQQQSKPLLFPSSDPPSKVATTTTLFRVLAVSREGLEKVYSAQVKVNNSFWDYHLTEHSANDQQVYYREQENLNQQADDSKTWTQNDDVTAASASDSDNNKSISSSPAVAATTKFSGGGDDHHRLRAEKTGNQKKKKGSSDEQIEKVDKLDEKIKVESKGGGGGGDGDVTANNFNGSSTVFSSSSNDNSNQILVFPSKESLRQTLGVGRGLSGEMKVKKLMSLLKQKKKKSENEVDNDNHHLLSSGGNNVMIMASSSSPPPMRSSSSGKEDKIVAVSKKAEINFSKEKDESKSNNVIGNDNEVKIPSLKITMKENMTTTEAEGGGEGGTNETEKSPNWGLHTVSMIYQKFLVVTQVTWDYPGEEEQEKTENGQNDENGNITNSRANSDNNKNGRENKEENGGTTKKIPSSSSAPSKKWKGCGSRASNSNNAAGSGVDTGAKGEQQLNFLLSWEIFGGGLRGNLVTDTCSASISLWPDTAYIIQVGLITPNKMDAASAGENGMSSMTETNGQDFPSSYSSYLAAWQNSYNSKQARQSTDDNDENGNKLSNHVPPYMSNYVDVKNSEHEAGHEDYKSGVGESTLGSSSSTTAAAAAATPSSFDPLILPESITFPFDGEPKVTIKSERILVNTTRAGESKLEDDEGDATTNADDDSDNATHNQDKVTPGNNQSNNNFLTPDQKKRKDNWNNGHVGKEQEEINDEQLVLVKKNFESSNDSGGGSSRRPVSGINDKVNVSPITITSNGHSESGGGPAFEEEEAAEMLMLQEENDQPEVESLQRLRRPPPQLSPSSSALYRQGKVEQTAKTAAAAGAVNEDADQENNSSVWSDEDEDDATDQDESLFARSLAHQNHQQHRHPQRNSNKNIPPSSPEIRSVSLPQPHTQPEVEEQQNQQQQQQRNINNNNVQPKSLTSKFHSFMTVNSFYQSLYALSRNALELSHRYPNVITITNEGSGGGAGNKHGNGSSPSSLTAVSTSGDANIGPLLIGGFGNSNRTGYLFSATHSAGSEEDDEDSSGIKGKLYTLFVILVISFVIFLFIVAIVGFCVLTSSIKENYKYFVPKKMRVWTTVGQLIKGSNANQAGGSSSSSNGGGGGLFKDSAEGSFYPRRLQEEPDYEFDDNEDFDPDDDDDEEEEATSVAETDEEDDDDVESECDCHCVTDNEIVELEDEENSFSLNERCSSDTVKLIKDGEESSVELMAAVDEENEDNGGGGVGERRSCGVGGGGVRCNSSRINTSSCSNRGGASQHHHHHRGNCDNNNPCYHTTPGTGGGRILQSAIIFSAAAPPPPVKASPVAAALSSLKKNFHRVSSSSSSNSKRHHQRQINHHPHCTHHHQQHHKRKSDVRIDVTGTGGSSRSGGARNLLNQRQEGYY